jgi:hypothetical protein
LALDERPALRQVLRTEFTYTLIPQLRLELAEGKLDFSVARKVMRFVGQHAGGVLGMAPVDWPSRFDPECRDPVVAPSAKERLYLGRQTVLGPPTSQEWDAFRRARRTAELADAHDAFLALQLTPPECPWHPEDRAFFDRALADAEGEPEDWLLVQLGWVLFSLGEPADLPLFDRLEDLAELDPFARPSIINMRAAFRTRLGLPEENAEAKAAAEDTSGWTEDAG